MQSSQLKYVFLPLVALAFSASANASYIDSTTLGGGGGGMTIVNSSIVTNSIGNGLNGPWQPPGPLANTIYANEEFSTPLAVGAAIYHLHPAGPTEYSVTFDVKNTSGVTWTGYDIWFGYSNTDWFALGTGFTPTIAGPVNDTLNAVSTLTNTSVDWSGLNVLSGDTITMKFNFDIPYQVYGSWRFSEQPVAVPEVGTLACFAPGALLLLRGRSRRC